MEQLRLRLDALAGGPGAAVAASVGGRRQEAAVGSAAGRPFSPDTPFRIASLTKTLTAAAAVMACRDRGRPLDVPLVELLPQLADDWRAAPSLSLAQVLGQVSGLRESVDAATLATLGDGEDALIAGARLVVRAGQEHRPGSRWSYYNGNYFLAGAALAGLAQAPYEEALRGFVLAPARLAHTGFDTPRNPVSGPSGETDYPRSRRPSGGLWSTVEDLVAFGEWLLADRALLDEIRRPRTPAGAPMPYGLGWALGPSGQMYVNGRLPGYRAVLLMIPDARLVIAALANDDDALPRLAAVVSDLQRPFSGDDLAEAIDGFAA